MESGLLSAFNVSLPDTPLTARVRITDIRDAEGIARVHVASSRAAYRGILPDELLNWLRVPERQTLWRRILPDSRVQVAVLEDNAVVRGFVSIGSTRDMAADRHTGEVNAVDLDPGMWRKGHGTSLMNWALLNARANGWSRLAAWILPGNTRAGLLRAHAIRPGWRGARGTGRGHRHHRSPACPPNRHLVDLSPSECRRYAAPESTRSSPAVSPPAAPTSPRPPLTPRTSGAAHGILVARHRAASRPLRRRP